MRTAVCISGMLRNFEHTYPRLKQFVLDPLNADVFLYSTPSPRLDQAVSLYQPKAWGVQPSPISFDGLGFRAVLPSTNYHNACSQFFNIRVCDALRQNYESQHKFKYDLVLRVRPDAFFKRPFEVDEISDARNGKVVVPWGWHFESVYPHAITDIFAMTSSASMSVYSSLFDHLHKYTYLVFHPETLVGHHLMVNNIRTRDYVINFQFEYPDELKQAAPRLEHPAANARHAFDNL